MVHLDNWFLNRLIMYVSFIGLCFILPPFYIIKILKSIFVSLFYKEENMEGKVVLITGASSGIGEHMAYEYARRKASLALVARRENRLKKVADAARELGSPDVIYIRADVSSADDCKMFVDQTIKHFGQLNHLVNNAGVGYVSFFQDVADVKKVTPVMDINFWGSVYPTHYAIPHLKKSKGKILVNSSDAALLNPPASSFYNASKSAVISFYESLRCELAPEVTITIITPGFVESEITQGKQMSNEGAVPVNDLVKVLTGGFPRMNTEPCAKSIVEGACRGERYVTEPPVMRVANLMYFLCPELVQWLCEMFLKYTLSQS